MKRITIPYKENLSNDLISSNILFGFTLISSFYLVYSYNRHYVFPYSLLVYTTYLSYHSKLTNDVLLYFIYPCMMIFLYKYRSIISDNSYYKLLITGTYLSFIYMIGFINITMYLLGLGLLIIIGLYLFALAYSFFVNRNMNKTVTIVRGVPGIGKFNFVVWQEYESEEASEFKICSWQDYFGKGASYKYNPRLVKEVENKSLNDFIQYMIKGIRRIYILSTFEKVWQYRVYVELARLFGYNCRIVELECRDMRDLKYFQMRSKHNVPYDKAVRIFNEWEVDDDAVLCEPYKDDCVGDSIPLYGSVNKEKLDNELEKYRKGYIQNDFNDCEIEEKNRSDMIVPHMSSFNRRYVGLI